MKLRTMCLNLCVGVCNMGVKLLVSEKLKYANAWGLPTFMQLCGCRCGHHRFYLKFSFKWANYRPFGCKMDSKVEGCWDTKFWLNACFDIFTPFLLFIYFSLTWCVKVRLWMRPHNLSTWPDSSLELCCLDHWLTSKEASYKQNNQENGHN